MAGKGSRARPLSVSKSKFDDNWDKIFGKKEEPKTEVIANLYSSHAHIDATNLDSKIQVDKVN